MRSVIFFIFLFLILSISSIAQEVQWGTSYEKGGMPSSYPIKLANKTGEFYSLNLDPNKKESKVVSFDSDHNKKGKSTLGFKHGKKNVEPSGFIHTSSKSFAYSLDYRNNPVSLQTINLSNGEMGNAKTVFKKTFETQVKSSSFVFRNVVFNLGSTEFKHYKMSENKKFILFAHAFPTKNKKKDEKYSILVFNENMELVWEKIFDIPREAGNHHLRDFNIANNGNVLLYSNYCDKIDDQSNSNCEPMFFYMTATETKKINIGVDDGKFITDWNIHTNEEGNIMLNGFYALGENNEDHSGMFTGAVNFESGALELKTFPFSSKFLLGLSKKGKTNLDSDFIIKDQIAFPDGTFSFLAERTYTKSYSSSNVYLTFYMTDEIVIPRFSEDGELIHVEKIEKSFTDQIKVRTSYCYYKRGNKIYLLFNDIMNRDKNPTKTKNKKYGHGKMYTQYCIVNEEGRMEEKQTLFFTTKDAFIPALSFGKGNKFILGKSNKHWNRYQFGSMQLEE